MKTILFFVITVSALCLFANNALAQLSGYKVTWSNEIILPFSDVYLYDLSFDGLKLLYIKDDFIWISKANGADSKQLPVSKGDYLAPQWSPDGTKILYVADSGFSLWLMNSDGSQQTRLLKSDTGEIMTPVWWPDANKIFFYMAAGSYRDDSDTLKSHAGIYEMDLTTKKYKPFGFSSLSGGVCFLPDKKTAVFLYNKNLIFFSTINGAEIKRIALKTTLVGRAGPVCTSDGKYIVIDNFLYVIATSEEIPFLPDAIIRYQEQGKPDLKGPNFIVLSKDNKKIAFSMCPLKPDMSYSKIKIMDLTWQ